MSSIPTFNGYLSIYILFDVEVSMNIAPESDPEEETDSDQYKMQRTSVEQEELSLNSYVSCFILTIWGGPSQLLLMIYGVKVETVILIGGR